MRELSQGTFALSFDLNEVDHQVLEKTLEGVPIARAQPACLVLECVPLCFLPKCAALFRLNPFRRASSDLEVLPPQRRSDPSVFCEICGFLAARYQRPVSWKAAQTAGWAAPRASRRCSIVSSWACRSAFALFTPEARWW